MLLKLLHHSTIITLSSCSGSFLYFALDDIKKRHNTRVRFEELDLKVKPDRVIKQFLNPGFAKRSLYHSTGQPLSAGAASLPQHCFHSL